MRKILMLAAAVAVAGAGTGALAQSAPSNAPSPPGPQAAAPGSQGTEPGMERGMGGGWRHQHAGERGEQRAEQHGEHRAMGFGRTFGLFAPQPDKHLSPADVQQIAQAILLWNGNHDWKVAQVQSGPNHQVTFAYTSPDGTVIAKFAINQDTGRISRLG